MERLWCDVNTFLYLALYAISICQKSLFEFGLETSIQSETEPMPMSIFGIR